MAKTIGDLIMEYFKKHPKENLSHGPVVDWVEKEYINRIQTMLWKSNCLIFLLRRRKKSLERIIIDVWYAGAEGKMVSRYVQII